MSHKPSSQLLLPTHHPHRSTVPGHATRSALHTPETASYLKIGTPIHVVFKETEVVLAKTLENEISMLNRVKGTVKEIEEGTLLTKVMVNTKIGSITAFITTEAVETLQLKEGNEICAMVQTTEIMLSE